MVSTGLGKITTALPPEGAENAEIKTEKQTSASMIGELITSALKFGPRLSTPRWETCLAHNQKKIFSFLRSLR